MLDGERDILCPYCGENPQASEDGPPERTIALDPSELGLVDAAENEEKNEGKKEGKNEGKNEEKNAKGRSTTLNRL